MLETAMELSLHLSWKTVPELVLGQVTEPRPQPVPQPVQELVLAWELVLA
eukprot:COSAG02_NODE_4670_length_5112_cov_2823.117295_6_plen_50_part_00